jgi:spore germination cell wall hydrolase CwlJ-like protein
MGLKSVFGAIALAAMALAGSTSASAEVTGAAPSTTLAMNLPTTTLPIALAPLQPALSAAAQSFATLAEKVSATEANLAAVDSQLRCLATAIYFEARSEPVEGQLAVAQVIRNRTRSGRFPASICGVVNQPSQFSFSRRRSPDNQAQWLRAVKIAAIAMADGWRQIVPDALYFHAARVSPGWSMRRIARIGNNIFYR